MLCNICVPLWAFIFLNAQGAQEVSFHHSEMGCQAARSYHRRQGHSVKECVQLPDDVSTKFQWSKRNEE